MILTSSCSSVLKQRAVPISDPQLPIQTIMYWPLGTPRIFSSKVTNAITTYDSDDHNETETLVALSPADDTENPNSRSRGKNSILVDDSSLKDNHGVGEEEPDDLEKLKARGEGGEAAGSSTYTSRKESLGPHRALSGLLEDGIKSESSLDVTFSEEVNDQAANNAILALKMSRNGALFATITCTELTIWQTKVCQELITSKVEL